MIWKRSAKGFSENSSLADGDPAHNGGVMGEGDVWGKRPAEAKISPKVLGSFKLARNNAVFMNKRNQNLICPNNCWVLTFHVFFVQSVFLVQPNNGKLKGQTLLAFPALKTKQEIQWAIQRNKADKCCGIKTLNRKCKSKLICCCITRE